MMIIYTVLVVTITILVQAVWKWTHKEEHLGLEVRPRKGLGCGLAPPPDEIPGDAQPVAGRRVEVRPRKDLGCGLPSRLEVRPVEETGCGLASPLGENQEGLPSDAQLSAGRRLEVRPVEETGCGLASPLGENQEGLPSDARSDTGRRVEVRPRQDLGCGLPSRLEVRPVEETGCGLASPLEGGKNISPSDARSDTGRRVEVRPRQDLGCGLPSRLEVRPVEETGLASPPLEEMTSRSSGDAQPGAGRELEVLPEENPGGGLAPGSSIGPRLRPETSGERSSATRENIDGTSRLPPGVTLTGDQICQVDGSIIPRITQLMVAGNGKRYHNYRNCTGVKMSPNVRDVHVCQICLEKYNCWTSGSTILYARSINHVMHTSRRHYDQVHPGHEPRIFEPCQVCQPFEM